jgi:hypothetical protein
VKVKKLTIVGERLKSMREALRNKEAPEILIRENFTMPVQKGRRIRAQIHGHVKDPASQTRDELRFGMWRMLKMEAANRSRQLGESVINSSGAKMRSR